MDRKPVVDKITQRSFASFSMDDVQRGVPGNMASLCWARLDGVWRDNHAPMLDREKDNPDVWSSDTPQLISLANGNYTTPRYLVIEDTGQPDETLRLTPGLAGTDFAEFVSNDGIPLTQVLKRGGKVKTYTTRSAFIYGNRFSIDITRTGRIRLNFDRVSFMRPQPGVSKAASSEQLPADDAFLLSYNLDNLAASRKGYDLMQQDPFYLLQNPKSEIFARVDPRNYYITEKRTVPVGLSLVQEGAQGYVFRKQLVSSATEVQRTYAHSFGVNVYYGKRPAATFTASAGINASQNESESMRRSKSVAKAIGYTRSKKYALVVDHPYVTLSDDFIDAVDDALRYHRYGALLKRFGTHYPYAVTYGAMARMTQSFDKTAYIERAQKMEGFAWNGGASIYGAGGDVQESTRRGTGTGSSGSIGNEGVTFVGVGGNGSWDHNGFAAGDTPVPILLDLRPVSELLNPMNFPGEPEIYDRVRRNLERAIAHHIQTHYRPLSDRSWLPPVPEAKIEEEAKPHEEVWHAYVRHAWCKGTAITAAKVKELSGRITISKSGPRGKDKTARHLDPKCKLKAQKIRYSYKSGDFGLLTFRGTRAEIAKHTIKFQLDYQLKPWKKQYSNKKNFSSSVLKNGLAVGTSKTQQWKITNKGQPDVFINMRLKRIK